MRVVFQNSSLFFSSETLQPLDRKSWRLVSPIPKQMIDNESTESFEDAADMMDKVL
jgi:hypothetical protein